ncbi:MAG: hypothetical protein E6021_12865, partial [Staphylococcus epidermidis]|nr:hypothetical protein [Staphylococcus epidermidis]
HHHVGIISYINVKGKPIVGKYKKATISPHRSPYHTLNILWKHNLLIMLKQIRDPFTFRSGYNYNKNGRYTGGAGNFSQTTQSKRMKKFSVINQIIKYLGEENTYKLFTRVVIYGYNDRWKVIEEDFFNVVKNGVESIRE